MSQTETSEVEAIDPERGTSAPGARAHPGGGPGRFSDGGSPSSRSTPRRCPPSPAVPRPDRPRCASAAAESSWPRSARSATRSSAGWPAAPGLIIVLAGALRRRVPALAGPAQPAAEHRQLPDLPQLDRRRRRTELRHRRAAVDHGADRRDGHGARRAGGRRRRAVPHPIRAQAGLRPALLRRRPAGCGAVDHLRSLGSDRARPLHQSGRRLADRPSGLHPALRPRGHRQELGLRGRGGVGHHDLADRHRDLPGRVRPDPPRPRRGRVRPGRHPLGDDPHRRAARTVAPA